MNTPKRVSVTDSDPKSSDFGKSLTFTVTTFEDFKQVAERLNDEARSFYGSGRVTDVKSRRHKRR